jgi:hypothetical protein
LLKDGRDEPKTKSFYFRIQQMTNIDGERYKGTTEPPAKDMLNYLSSRTKGVSPSSLSLVVRCGLLAILRRFEQA